MFKKIISENNYLTIRSMEHAFDVKYTKEEIEKLLKVLKEFDANIIKNGSNSTQTRSKI